MATYSSWNGAKVHASEYLISTVLKQELGFRGLVVSDYNAVQQCAPSFSKALVACVNAGVDMIMTAGGLIGFARDVHWQKQAAPRTSTDVTGRYTYRAFRTLQRVTGRTRRR